jgi:hypothetical protein
MFQNALPTFTAMGSWVRSKDTKALLTVSFLGADSGTGHSDGLIAEQRFVLSRRWAGPSSHAGGPRWDIGLMKKAGFESGIVDLEPLLTDASASEQDNDRACFAFFGPCQPSASDASRPLADVAGSPAS